LYVVQSEKFFYFKIKNFLKGGVMKHKGGARTVFTWGYDWATGQKYLDSHFIAQYVDPRFLKLALRAKMKHILKRYEAEAHTLQMMKIRQRAQSTWMVVLVGVYDRDFCEALVKTTPDERLKEMSRG